MKKITLFTALTALLFVAGCSTTTTLTTPEQHPEKYALQIIRIEVPVSDTYEKLSLCDMVSGFSEDMDMDMYTDMDMDMDSLLKNPDAVITEYPIAYAAVGETGINDQTETVSMPESYEPKVDTNGVMTVVYQNKDIKLGQYVEMTLRKVENGAATCDLWFYEKSLQGMQQYSVAPAAETHAPVKASMPVFKKREMKTKITLAPGNWMSMGGLINEKTEDFSSGKKAAPKTTRTETVLAIRILPPKNSL